MKLNDVKVKDVKAKISVVSIVCLKIFSFEFEKLEILPLFLEN